MGVMDFLRNMKQRRVEREYADDETRDKHLRSLRRQRRVQLEEFEKIRLKREVEEHIKARNQRYRFGVKDKSNPFAQEEQVEEHRLIRPQHQMVNKNSRVLRKREGFMGKYNMRGGGMI